jgi:hypothetical protein
LWRRLRRKPPPIEWRPPPDDPALVPTGPPKRPRPAGAVELPIPEPEPPPADADAIDRENPDARQ